MYAMLKALSGLASSIGAGFLLASLSWEHFSGEPFNHYDAFVALWLWIYANRSDK